MMGDELFDIMKGDPIRRLGPGARHDVPVERRRLSRWAGAAEVMRRTCRPSALVGLPQTDLVEIHGILGSEVIPLRVGIIEDLCARRDIVQGPASRKAGRPGLVSPRAMTEPLNAVT